MTWAAALGFLLAIVPIVITPGVSFTLATQRALQIPLLTADARLASAGLKGISIALVR